MSLRPLFCTILINFSIVTPCFSDDVAQPDVAAGVSGVVNEDTVTRFSPNAQVAVVREIVRSWNKADSAGINNLPRILQFFAEIATETGGMTSLDERLNYTAKQLVKTWPSRFDANTAAKYAGNEVAIANYVYNGRNGNKAGTDDGWVYRGGGLMQLTGRGNYRARSLDLGLGTLLEDNPDKVRLPELAFQTAYSYWAKSGASDLADKGDTKGVRKAVNGGLIGLPNTLIWLAQARRVFSPPQVAESATSQASQDENSGVLSRLQSLGYVNPSVAAGEASANTIADGLKAFQKEQGLPQTGTVDDATRYKLTDPLLLPKE